MPTVAAPRPEAVTPQERSDRRYRLLGGLWRTSNMRERAYTAADGQTVWIRDNTLTRVHRCRRQKLPNQRPGVTWDNEQAHHHGVATCASIWACPVCSAKIRRHRTEEVKQILNGHLAEGGHGGFVTLTLSHTASDRLEDLIDAISDTWRRVISGRAWSALSELYGIDPNGCDKFGMKRRIGLIRPLEIKHSTNGFHPHLHAYILYNDTPLLPGHARNEIRQHITDTWRAVLKERGYKVGARIGVLWKDITPDNIDTIAAYGCKVQDGTDNLALELTRPDLKTGGKARSGRGMFDVLAGWVIDGDLQDAAIWLEYERATKGRQAITFARGLRDRFNVEVKTDEELAEERVGGENTYWYDDTEWTWVRQTTERIIAVHQAARTGGQAALLDLFFTELGHCSGGDGGITARAWLSTA